MTIQDMKKSAKLKLSGNYLKCVLSALIYFIVVLVLTYSLKFITLKLNQQILELAKTIQINTIYFLKD